MDVKRTNLTHYSRLIILRLILQLKVGNIILKAIAYSFKLFIDFASLLLSVSTGTLLVKLHEFFVIFLVM